MPALIEGPRRGQQGQSELFLIDAPKADAQKADAQKAEKAAPGAGAADKTSGSEEQSE
jgi:hypothetical protein